MAITKSDLRDESQGALTLTAFLGGAALFFAGILVAQINNFSPSLKVPIVYLVLATLAFIFSSIIYTNVSGHIRLGSLIKAKRAILVANALSEFLGIYLFVIAIPMVLNAITQDLTLRYIVDAAAIVSLVWYTYSEFSIFNRSFSKVYEYFFSTLLAVLMSALYLLQGRSNSSFVACAVILLLVLLLAMVASDESKKGRS